MKNNKMLSIKLQINQMNMTKLFISAILLFTFIVPALLIHEAAHGLICAYYGHDVSIEWNTPTFGNLWDISGSVTCTTISLESELFPYWLAGGMTAGVVFVCFLSIRYVRQNVWLMAPIIAIAIKEFLTAYLETTVHFLYMAFQFELILPVVLGVSWILVWIAFIYRQRNNDPEKHSVT